MSVSESPSRAAAGRPAGLPARSPCRRGRRDAAVAWWRGDHSTGLDEERRAGTVGPGLDSPTTAALLTWMVERTISMHCRDDDTSGDAQVARSVGRAVWLAVYGDAPSGS
ncbi:hypothetical protein [Actinocorallia libanotica]